MTALSVVIPSRNETNLRACVQAIRVAGETCRIIVVWDGESGDGTSPEGVADWWCVGMKPFIFARNCNLGIAAAGDNVLLLNDDALLESPGGFSLMQRAAAEHPEYGLISATTNVAGNPAQWRMEGSGLRTCPSPTPGNSFATVAFVCVLIPRRTIEAVGLLDERFTAYGWEDNDYCRRVHLAGLEIGIHDGCYVDHAKLTSTFRGQAFAAGDINAGRKIYMEKWGSA